MQCIASAIQDSTKLSPERLWKRHLWREMGSLLDFLWCDSATRCLTWDWWDQYQAQQSLWKIQGTYFHWLGQEGNGDFTEDLGNKIHYYSNLNESSSLYLMLRLCISHFHGKWVNGSHLLKLLCIFCFSQHRNISGTHNKSLDIWNVS